MRSALGLPEEDELLRKQVQRHRPRNWQLVIKSMPGRSGMSCQNRWCNQLSPDVDHRPFTPEEDKIIIQAPVEHGNRWATIGRLLNGQTDTAVKNCWNSTLKRRQSAAGQRPDKKLCVHEGRGRCPAVRNLVAAPAVPPLQDEPGSTQNCWTMPHRPPPGSHSQPTRTTKPTVGSHPRAMLFGLKLTSLVQEMVRAKVRIFLSGG